MKDSSQGEVGRGGSVVRMVQELQGVFQQVCRQLSFQLVADGTEVAVSIACSRCGSDLVCFLDRHGCAFVLDLDLDN